MPDVAVRVIVLNGGSSAGKSSIARCLQDVLPGAWLTFGVDTLVDAMPPALQNSTEGIEIGPNGEVSAGAEFGLLDAAWTAGIAAMVRAGARVIIDEVFLGGTASQERWCKALRGLPVLWVGVRCNPAVAAAREAARGDRVAGMAESQARLVHEGVTYDLEVDTTAIAPAECAQLIAAHVH
jgi:chloramphenicol 3-O phosphotransferase